MCENGCGCSTSAEKAPADVTIGSAPLGITATYTVTGMTCGHCVNAVSSEVGAIPGVRDVTVDLAGGTVTVASDKPLDTDQVKAAVEEAGYELVSSP